MREDFECLFRERIPGLDIGFRRVVVGRDTSGLPLDVEWDTVRSRFDELV